METLYDQNELVRIIMTVVALVLCIGPAVADFNRTHATNPLWPGHARFHVVWQVLAQAGVSSVILVLIWMPSSEQVLHTWLAAMLNYVWGISFFCTLATMPMFDGALKDVNGIPPFRFRLPGGEEWLVDTNLFGGTILMILNTIGVVLLAAS